MPPIRLTWLVTLLASGLVTPLAHADEAASPEAWNVHGQSTVVEMGHAAFPADYSGANSLSNTNNLRETLDATLFAGIRLWKGAALYTDAEIDQGFGLNNTLGIAAFPSGAAYKVGAQHPYFRLPKAFVRQVVSLGQGSSSQTPAGANQLADTTPDDNLTLTVGKFSVVDVFDNNRYAHDPRADFLNWAVIDAGAFDYAADAWGYTYGATAEWNQSWWTVRAGLFALSKQPNSKDIDGQFHQYSTLLEAEGRYRYTDHPGKLRLTLFDNHGQMGRYDAAIALANSDGSVPNTALVRHQASSLGGVVNLEQEWQDGLGSFVRLSWNQGAMEAFEFTEINKSMSVGLSVSGSRWGRPDDSAGTALVVSGLSSAAQRYFAQGGLGILIGDGNLNYGLEKISETYYSRRLAEHLVMSADFQWVVNPAYNRDRGPVPVFGLRLHADF